VTAILILAWAFGLVAIVAVGRYITSLGEDIDAPVPLALYRARCDEVERLQARVRLLEAQLASVEQEG
jgi:hypothetical protein